MENTEKETTPKIIFFKVIQHPIFSILVIPLLIALIFFLLGTKDIKPRFSIKPSELIAEQTDNAPELKLFWDKSEISNISSVEIAFWNGGRDYIDKDKISTTDNIKIMIPDGITVLSYRVISTSRDDLDFSIKLKKIENGEQFIDILIKGDEALERSDGGIIKILYTGSSNSNFYITGRIKGSRTGFVEIPWRNGTVFSIIVQIIVFPLVIFSTRKEFSNAIKFLFYPKEREKGLSKKFTLAKTIAAIILLSVNLFGIVFFIVVISQGSYSQILTPAWIFS